MQAEDETDSSNDNSKPVDQIANADASAAGVIAIATANAVAKGTVLMEGLPSNKRTRASSRKSTGGKAAGDAAMPSEGHAQVAHVCMTRMPHVSECCHKTHSYNALCFANNECISTVLKCSLWTHDVQP